MTITPVLQRISPDVSGMTIRFLIIEPSPEYRSLLSHHLTTRWPDAAIMEYDPVQSGRLAPEFSGAGNDVVILGDPLGEDRGLDWLRRFRMVRTFPPVIILGDANERSIVEAIKAGATDYISRDKLNHKTFIEICESAIESASLPDAEQSASSISARGLQIPDLKGYTIRKQISGGDIASVYLSEDVVSGRSVVLKVLQQMPDSGTADVAFERFLREFELIGKINHANVVRIYSLGIADDHAYIAMEYCSRGSLKRRIKTGMYADRAEEIMRQIADALGALHEVGILHRDLKPTNVLFRDDDSVALIDFGLAKQTQLTAELTGAGEIFGTPYYMSPEQGHGEAVDRRSDIYSLGVIFYEMLTGKKPYQGGTAMAVILKHARDPVPRLPAHLAKYQPAIDRMLAKRPEHRFQSVTELLQWKPAIA
jgi:DNA-binding NarL/FixJ family response regulator